MATVTLNEDALRNLPIGRYVGVEQTTNMDGDYVLAIRWYISVGQSSGEAFFDARTGEYISHCMSRS